MAFQDVRLASFLAHRFILYYIDAVRSVNGPHQSFEKQVVKI